jgi:[ribosomal protein S18]-alanine N-acetyltransferase
VPAWRGRGTGRAFLRALLDEVGELGASSLLLTVAPDNQAALDLYRGEGFVVAGEVPGFYGPGGDRLLLRWRAVR